MGFTILKLKGNIIHCSYDGLYYIQFKGKITQCSYDGLYYIQIKGKDNQIFIRLLVLYSNKWELESIVHTMVCIIFNLNECCMFV